MSTARSRRRHRALPRQPRRTRRRRTSDIGWIAERRSHSLPRLKPSRRSDRNRRLQPCAVGRDHLRWRHSNPADANAGSGLGVAVKGAQSPRDPPVRRPLSIRASPNDSQLASGLGIPTRCEITTSGELKMTTKTLLTPTEVWSAKIYSNGWKKPGLGTADVIEKATGAKLGEIGVASAEDVSAAAAAAHEAQKEWAKLPGPERGDVLRELSRLMLAHSKEIAGQLVRETGSIRAKAQWEIEMTAREFQEATALASQPQGILTATLEAGRQSIARRLPIGAIGIITPWNSPFILGARAIAPALAMGNAVILKPDLQTPIIGGVTFARLLEEAGLPNGLFHVLPGGADTGAAVVKEPLINMISFTGSTRVGRQVGTLAGGQLKPVSLELGGNNPYIVLDDAEIDAAASAGAWGAFFHQGQICLTAGRHLVHERVACAYVEALVRKAKALVIGDPFDERVQVGPIINGRQASNVDRIVAETIAKGGKFLTGGSRNTLFLHPTA